MSRRPMFGKKIDRFLRARTLARIILRLTNLLLLCPHRNRRTCFNFAGFGIEDPHCLFLIDKRMRLRQSVQLFQVSEREVPNSPFLDNCVR
jgi:hypothetical protein